MTLSMFKGNRLPVLQDTITLAATGAAVDLTGSTVLFSMRPNNSAQLKVSGATATIVTAASGTVSYAWAANDTDTVGSYRVWWQVNSNGKSQDTPETALTVTEHAPASVQIIYPVAADGTTTIYQGDAYLHADSRHLQYELEPMDAPDLTGSSIVFKIEGGSTFNMTLVGEDAAYLELTSTQTTAISAGTYNFAIRANPSVGNFITLMRSTLHVTAALA